MVKYVYEVEVEQTFTRTKTMRIVAANEEDLEDKVQERTQGDGTRLRADDSDAFIVCIVEEAELPTATKY
tara:strand:- start:99 stop:308 length:210 start_codon:yes stop_codon:yes gene_type:complete